MTGGPWVEIRCHSTLAHVLIRKEDGRAVLLRQRCRNRLCGLPHGKRETVWHYYRLVPNRRKPVGYWWTRHADFVEPRALLGPEEE